MLNRHLLVGVQAGLQAALGGSEDTEGGPDLSLLAAAKVYPSKMAGLHLRLGAGMLIMKDETISAESDAIALKSD